jgi:uncharacterized protein YdaU (DUF1376 family)
MTDLPAMMLWTDAYAGDTGHLTTTEHGAYFLILMAMWRAGGCLPDDDVRLARIAKLTLDKWRRMSPTIREFMTVDGNAIFQKRLKLEFEIASGRREKYVTAGSSGGRAKALKYNIVQSSDATESLVAINKHRSSNQNQNHTQIEKKEISTREIEKLADEFYQAYPKHVDPLAAKTKFAIRVRSGVDPSHIIDAAKRLSAAHKLAGTDKQFIPAPAVWLNKGGYDSEDLPRAGPSRLGDAEWAQTA